MAEKWYGLYTNYIWCWYAGEFNVFFLVSFFSRKLIPNLTVIAFFPTPEVEQLPAPENNGCLEPTISAASNKFGWNGQLSGSNC